MTDKRFDTRPKGATNVRGHERRTATGTTWVREHYRRIGSTGWTTKRKKVRTSVDGNLHEVTPEIKKEQFELLLMDRLREETVIPYRVDPEIFLEEMHEVRMLNPSDESITFKVYWDEAETNAREEDMGTLIGEIAQEISKPNKQWQRIFGYDSTHPESLGRMNYNPFDHFPGTSNEASSMVVQIHNGDYRFTPTEIKEIKEEMS
jgi:hypothetical protein